MLRSEWRSISGRKADEQTTTDKIAGSQTIKTESSLKSDEKHEKKRNQALYHDRNEKELAKLDEGSTVRVYQHSSASMKANW